MRHADWIIPERKIRFAVVGCGRISKNHFDSIKAHSNDIDLVGVCDTDPQALHKAVSSLNVPGFLSIAELLKQTEPDIVVLATPSGLHASQAMEVAHAGVHVISEKPMATRWNDGKRMVQVCDEMGVRLFVVKQNRLNQTLRLLKEAIDSGRMGRIYMVNVNVFWSRPQSYYDSAPWRGTWEFDGGAFMNQASHYVDLLDWMIGPVESVQAYSSTLARNIEVEDTGVASIKWRSGALGSMNVTMLTYPRNYEGSLTILGEKGRVRVGGVAVNEIQAWEFENPHPSDALVQDANYQTTSVYGFGHPLYYKNLIDTLRGTAEPATDGREGLRSLELLVAIYLASRQGRRIALPLDY